jgi:hypothetical protein
VSDSPREVALLARVRALEAALRPLVAMVGLPNQRRQLVLSVLRADLEHAAVVLGAAPEETPNA